MIKRVLRLLLYQLDKSWKDPVVHVESDRRDEDGLIALSMYYFLQIFLYQIASDSIELIDGISGDDKKNIQYIQILGTVIGAAIGAMILLRRRSNKSEERDSIRILLQMYAIPLALSALALSAKPWLGLELEVALWVAYAAKFFFGIGWSVGIGCIIIWVCEYLPQFLRTSGAVFVGCVGFLGGALANCISFLLLGNEKNWMPVASFLICIGFLSLWRRLPDDSQLNYAYKHRSYHNEHRPLDFKSWFYGGIKKLIRSLVHDRTYRKLVVYSLIIGMGVQYYVKFVYYLDKMPREAMIGPVSPQEFPKITFDILTNQFWSLKVGEYKGLPQFFKMIRYAGMIFGGIILLNLSWWYAQGRNWLFNKRLPLITTVLIIQLILLLTIWHTQPKEVWINAFWALAIGVTCGVWPLCILAVAEQFSLRDRPIWVILAPNAYRTADIFLLLMISDAFTPGDFKDLVLLGLAILACGILSSLGMENNFDGDALYIKNNEPLNADKIRKEIRLKLKVLSNNHATKSSDTEDKIITACNETLAKHLTENLKEQLFAVGLFTYDKDQDKGVRLVALDVNPEAYDIYRPNKTSEPESMKVGFKIAARLAASEGVESLVQQILEKPNLRGAVLSCSPKTYQQKPLSEERYMMVNLNDFKIDHIQTHVHELEQLVEEPDEQKILARLDQFKNIAYRTTADWEKKRKKFEETFKIKVGEGLEKLFAFLRVDAGRYFPWRYYLQLLQPYSDDSKICLLIKTTVPLSLNRLEELHALLTFIELELLNKRLQNQVNDRERVIDRLVSEAEHNRKIELSRIKEKVMDLSAVDISAAERKQIVKETCANLQHLIEMTALHVSLMRFESIEGGIHDFREIQKIDLVKTLRNRWETLNSCLVFMNFSATGHKDSVEIFFKENEFDNILENKCKNCEIESYPAPLDVILFELLKNAIEKSDPERVSIRISIEEHDTFFSLGIENSISNARYLIENSNNAEQFQLNSVAFESPGRAGLRSVKRVMRFLNGMIALKEAAGSQPPTLWNMAPILERTHFKLIVTIPKKN